MADKFRGVILSHLNTPIFGISDWSDMGCKKPVLWIQDGENSRVKVASFNDERAAEMFAKVLESIFGEIVDHQKETEEKT